MVGAHAHPGATSSSRLTAGQARAIRGQTAGARLNRQDVNGPHAKRVSETGGLG